MSAERLARRLVERLGLGRLSARVMKPQVPETPTELESQSGSRPPPAGGSGPDPTSRELDPHEVDALRRQLAEELARLAARTRVCSGG